MIESDSRDLKQLMAMLGIHPRQLRYRIEKVLAENGQSVSNNDLMTIDYSPQGPRVEIYINEKNYGVFNYNENVFEDSIKKEGD